MQTSRYKRTLSVPSSYIREIVYGGTDGIITTFAVVAGFTGSQVGLSSSNQTTLELSFTVVLLFGLANLFADSVSMGLGNFLSIRAEKDQYKKEKETEQNALNNHTTSAEQTTKNLLKEQGFTTEQADQLTTIYKTNHEYWTEFMMRHKLELPSPEQTSPLLTTIATITAFVSFGFIPLLPYLLSTNASTSFILSIGFTALALLLLGIARWIISREKLIRSILEIVLLGSLAATVAYIVGTLFSL